MNTNSSLIILIVVFFSITCLGESTHSDSECSLLAQEFVDLLAKEDFSNAERKFSQQIQRSFPESKLRETWVGLIEKCGKFKRQVGVRSQRIKNSDLIFVTCEFEHDLLDIQLSYNKNKTIDGFYFVPTSPPNSTSNYKPPTYSHPDSLQEKEVIVGSGKWTLPGTLTIPLGKSPFPALVLVHGSGPNDRDESIGPNKPFRDLAEGLASKGIAVLRYEKRTKVHGAEMTGPFTVKEETVDDALEAVSLLRKTDSIHSKRIFVLGHSMGGMLLPRIEKQDSNIAGLISLAGSTRSLEDSTLEQINYLVSLDHSVSETEKNAQLKNLKKEIAAIKDPQLSPTSPPLTFLGATIPAVYFLDLRNYHPAETAKDLKQPMLILQGERDYQVTMEDFQGWKNALSSRDNVTFKSYPKLNHPFIASDKPGKCTPDEYLIPDHVSEEVINDIAEWIKKN
jgi:dienelactone hydrolase